MITVLGATGYIGSNMVKKLVETNTEVYVPKRSENLDGKKLGHIIYCIGLTADFRTKPFETVEAHVCMLNGILKNCLFESLTYLSSTRVYINAENGMATEEDKILIDPLHPDELYTLTKLTGERLCLSSGKNVKIIRLSNVFGDDFNSDNFLADIIRKIDADGEVILYSTLSSAKDYLFIDDAIKMILQIAVSGKEKIYNLASGYNTSNEEIINELRKNKNFSCKINENAKEVKFPAISIQKIVSEFNFNANNITQHISTLFKKA